MSRTSSSASLHPPNWAALSPDDSLADLTSAPAMHLRRLLGEPHAVKDAGAVLDQVGSRFPRGAVPLPVQGF